MQSAKNEVSGRGDALRELQASAKTGLPIFFVQLGNHINLFFDRVLQQAIRSNGYQNVFVLTDTNFQLYQNCNCIDVSAYVQGNREFDAVYRHQSTNTYVFEKACFDRWFIINDLAKEHNLEYLVHADCDVMIYEDLKPVYQNRLKDKYEGTMMFFQHGDNSVTSGHTSFWSRKMLDDFCNFTTDKYRNEAAFNILLGNTLAGKFLDNRNVSDMILLDVFRTEAKPNTLNLLALEDEGIAFDFNANVADSGWKNSYRLSHGSKTKKMERRAGGWYLQTADTTKPTKYVKCYTMHFQGYATKALIPLRTLGVKGPQNVRDLLAGRFAYLKRKAKLAQISLKGNIKRIIFK